MNWNSSISKFAINLSVNLTYFNNLINLNKWKLKY